MFQKRKNISLNILWSQKMIKMSSRIQQWWYMVGSIVLKGSWDMGKREKNYPECTFSGTHILWVIKTKNWNALIRLFQKSFSFLFFWKISFEHFFLGPYLKTTVASFEKKCIAYLRIVSWIKVLRFCCIKMITIHLH